jgi:hypothetical protein
MTREEIQEEALKATEGKKRISVVLGTGELLTFKSE